MKKMENAISADETENICSLTLMESRHAAECSSDDIVPFGISMNDLSEKVLRSGYLRAVSDDMNNYRAKYGGIRTVPSDWYVKSYENCTTTVLIMEVE